MLPWWSCGITEALMFNCLTFLLGTLWKQTKGASHSETRNQVFAIKNEALWSVLCLTALECHPSTLEQRSSRASRTFPWKTCLCQQGWKMISAVPILTWDATWKIIKKNVWYKLITSNYIDSLVNDTGIHIDWSLPVPADFWRFTHFWRSETGRRQRVAQGEDGQVAVQGLTGTIPKCSQKWNV